jgi:hypothetical protein
MRWPTHANMAEYILDKSWPEPNSGCWLWMGTLRPDGYGAARARAFGHGREQLAHRFSFMAFRGRIPARLYVLHRCDTKPCVNPAHLFTGTQADNLLDMRSKGRAAWQKKEA